MCCRSGGSAAADPGQQGSREAAHYDRRGRLYLQESRRVSLPKQHHTSFSVSSKTHIHWKLVNSNCKVVIYTVHSVYRYVLSAYTQYGARKVIYGVKDCDKT